MRQVTTRQGNGHQVHVLTFTRGPERRRGEVAYRMFSRWRAGELLPLRPAALRPGLLRLLYRRPGRPAPARPRSPPHQATPARIALGDLTPGTGLLDTETKLITHAIRMAAHNAQAVLARGPIAISSTPARDVMTVQKIVWSLRPSTAARYDRPSDRAKQPAAELLHVPYRHSSPWEHESIFLFVSI
jgi:hypothetical protein